MKVVRNKEGLLDLTGLTEGKLLCLHRLVGSKLDASEKKNGLEVDLFCVLEVAVQDFNPGLKETE